MIQLTTVFTVVNLLMKASMLSIQSQVFLECVEKMTAQIQMNANSTLLQQRHFHSWITRTSFSEE